MRRVIGIVSVLLAFGGAAVSAYVVFLAPTLLSQVAYSVLGILCTVRATLHLKDLILGTDPS